MPKMYFKEKILAKCVFTFSVTKIYYRNIQKTGNGHNKKTVLSVIMVSRLD